MLGYLITMLLTLMLGMIAFWTMEIPALTMLYSLINQFFGGALVPSRCFPGAGDYGRHTAFPGNDSTRQWHLRRAISVGRDALVAIGVQARVGCGASSSRVGDVAARAVSASWFRADERR